MRLAPWLACSIVLGLAGGCSSSTDLDPPNDAGAPPAADAGAAPRDAGATPDAGPRVDPYCDGLGFAHKPFDVGAQGLDFNTTVTDFELPTLDGAFRLSAAWTGCDAFVFLPVGQDVLQEDTAALLRDADRNTVFVFFALEFTAGRAREVVEAFRDDVINRMLSGFGEAEATFWRARVHYVTAARTETPLAAILSGLSGSDHFGVDQYQNLRRGGSLRVSTRAGWVPALTHGRYTAQGYNYEARLRERLEREARTLGERLQVVTVLDGTWADGTTAEGETDGLVRLELPSSDELARFDRAEVVVHEFCGTSEFPHEGERCSGEQGVHVWICETDCQAEAERYKFFKAISGYNTGGWWTLDATQALPLLRRGGAQTFRIGAPNTDPVPWRARITLRLYDDEPAEEAHPTATRWMAGWRGMGMQSVYDELTTTYRVVPPPGTTRVELRNLATTHGGGGNGGCGEFCTTEQAVHVNGQAFEHVWEQKETWDCAARVDQGVTPNQWGTWYFDRASWCPGFTGELWVSDLTSAFDLSGDNRLWLSATQSRAFPYTGTLEASPWLVFYGGDGSAPVVEPVAPEGCVNLHVRLRDFEDSFPDFVPMLDDFAARPNDDPQRQAVANVVEGAVGATLTETEGAMVPTLVWPKNTLPFTTAARFSEWFRDVEGVNVAVDLDDRVRRTKAGTAMILGHGVSPATVPPVVDETFGFGVGRHERLGSKTIEVWSSNVFAAGQKLRFGSSDDLWVYLDGRLVIDSGGFNGHFSSYNGYQRTHVLDLDAQGLTPGQTYEIRAFIADRGHDRNFNFWAEAPTCEPR